MPLVNLIEGSIFQNRYVCHILNLIVQVGLKHIAVATTKIKKIAKFIFCSRQKRQLYSTICARHNLSALKINPDVEHRSNFIYDLLNKAIERKKLI